MGRPRTAKGRPCKAQYFFEGWIVMVELSKIIGFIDEIAPYSYSMKGDCDGVDVCFDYSAPISKVLVCVDITMDAAEYAKENGYELIISHHTMIYNGLKKLDCAEPAANKALYLARNGISALSAHTRLDAAPGGVGDCLLECIGVDSASAMHFGNDDCENVGRIFELPKTLSVPDFADHVKKSLNAFFAENNAPYNDCQVNFVDNGRPVKRIAAVGGGGQNFFECALKYDIDTFFTGEVKYGSLMGIIDKIDSNGKKINFIVAGHFETEAVVLPSLCRRIMERFEGLSADAYYSDRVKWS